MALLPQSRRNRLFSAESNRSYRHDRPLQRVLRRCVSPWRLGVCGTRFSLSGAILLAPGQGCFLFRSAHRSPAFALPDLNGSRQSLADFRGRRLLVIFFNPRCGFCTRMVPDIAALPIDGANGAPLPLVVTTGEVEENRQLVAEHGIRCPVLIQ